MIEIKNVTKIYHAKKKSQHKALDNVNLTLQDNGLVFVIGKFGSGKSTLLNLIGGLDSVTEGNIVVDGNNITNYTDKQLSNYRSSHIGFIFQDYHLLEEMTVQENIQLSLKLIGQEDNGQVATALERVGLAGYENRYPDELSGGEQQRVAIARAIVKRPRLILADEPTGNLDNVTATSIIHLLKELAQDCLIIIVSHNTIDTYTYADRIIQLSAGKVVSDQSRNANFSTEILFKQDQLVYPCDKVLDDKDVGAINQHLQNNQLQKVVLVKDKYVQTEQPSTTNARTVAIPNAKPTRKSVGQLCKTFLQSKKLRIALYSFIVAVIIVVLALAETIMAFDSGKVIAREMLKENQTSLFVSKTNDLPNPIREGEKYYEMLDPSHVDLFKQEFSKSKVYPVYNSSVPITLYQNANGVQGVYMTKGTFRETFGTMLVDEQFFVDKLGTLEFEKVLPEDKIHPLGVYITDFVADQIVKYSTRYRNQTYDKILGQYTYSNTLMQPTYINGIIKTDYKAKYEKFLDELYRSTAKEAAELQEKKEYLNFLNDLYDHLGFSYTFNPNYLETLKQDPISTMAWTYNMKISDPKFNESIPVVLSTGRYVFNSKGNPSYNLDGNEVVMSYTVYNQIFGTSYTPATIKEFVPHDYDNTITQYKMYDYEFANPLNQVNVRITRLVGVGAMMVVSDELFQEFNKNSHYVQGIYFDQMENTPNVIAKCDELQYDYQHYLIEGMRTMTRAVEVFVNIFELVGGLLCAGVVFLLVSFASKMIQDKYREIGILKALGCKNGTISAVFGFQLLLLALCTVVLSVLGYWLFIDVANDVLVDSLQVLATNSVVLNAQFLTFIPVIAIINCVLILFLSAISFAFPMLKIRKINPVQIIKTREE